MKRVVFAILILFCSAHLVYAAVPEPVLVELQESFSHAISRVRPSVICVKAEKKRQQQGTLGQDFLWFESVGSGVVLDERGYVLTNYHVVEDASRISVFLWGAGNPEFTGSVVDKSRDLDLALLKISGTQRFEKAPLGNSDTLETGDWVITLGSPYGFQHSVSMGIISDLGRNMEINGVAYNQMIQTDAVINQGNSGGPLIDINGNVIGISTAIYAPDGTYTGLGFAIPINRAKHFFTPTIGAVSNAFVPVAATAAAPNNRGKESVNLNKPMPNDAIHKKFQNCLDCHVITQKMVVSKQATMTHPPVDACEKCHIMVKDKVVKGPTTVAATTSILPGAMQDMTYKELFSSLIIKLVLITLVSSVFFTMLGVGGGFMYVPILLSCGIDFHTATTTSLVMLTFAQVSALLVFFRSGLVDVRLVMILEFPTMIGAFLAGMSAHHFNITLLSLMFAGVLFLASYFMMQDKEQWQTAVNGGRVSFSPWEAVHEFRGNEIRLDLMLVMPLMFMVGYMGGLLGIAGGWLKVPLMMMLFNVPMKIAIASSSLMVPITGFAGFLGHSMNGHFDPRLALTLSVITVIGGQIGARLSVGTESQLLRFIFSFVLSIVGLWMIVRVF